MGQPDIRISNAERDAAVAALGEHLSTGRLELSEYDERTGQAVAARTRSQLEALFTDLPASHPDLSSATSPTPGQLRTRTRSRPKDLTATPASRFFGTVSGLAAFPGIPGAIVLTVVIGAWWVFLPVVGTLIVAGGISEACKNKPQRT